MTEPNIYAYHEYRKYLNDWFQLRLGKKRFSQRAFAKKAGFKTHNILQLIVTGRRNLTMKSVAKFATGLGLAPEEQRYFSVLVRMNQAASEKERLQAYEELCSFAGRRRVRPIEKPHLTFFRHWLAPVIFEMLQFPNFKPDPIWIAAQFTEEVKISEIRLILQDLLAADLVHVSDDGRWSPKGDQIFSGDNVRDVSLFSYHQVALAKAADALDAVPVSERQFHVLTSAIPVSALHEIKMLADKFESEFWRLIERQTAPVDEVVQVSFQIFPCVRGASSAKKEEKQ